jgi:hypothetical protein
MDSDEQEVDQDTSLCPMIGHSGSLMEDMVKCGGMNMPSGLLLRYLPMAASNDCYPRA